jgi:hypothetical protein
MYTVTTESIKSFTELEGVMDLIRDEIKVRKLLRVKQNIPTRRALIILLALLQNRRKYYSSLDTTE